jgi:6-pyruvoyltetrahydropterin/6-carboxytetrahydropterin synthase
MFTVTQVIDFCYGHRLLNYQGKCAHLHGHNGRAEIVVAAPALNPQCMVADFTDIDRVVRGFIDQHLDHRMLLHRDDPLVAALRERGEPVFLMDSDPTAESIARLICERGRAGGLDIHEVRLWETPTSVASYAPGR